VENISVEGTRPRGRRRHRRRRRGSP